MATSRTLLTGAAAFAGGYLLNQALRKAALNKVATCYITNYVASGFNKNIQEDDVLEWIEKAAPGEQKKGFVLHFHGDSPVDAIIYSKDHTLAKARVKLMFTENGRPRKFSFSTGPVNGDEHDDGMTLDSYIGHCPGCP